MPILVKPIRGRGIPVYTETTLTNRLSSEGILKFEMLEDEVNYDVIRAISRRWLVSNVEGPDDKKEYVIIMVDRESKGSKQFITVTARIKPMEVLRGKRVHSNISGSFTAEKYFHDILRDTNIDFELTHKVSSSRFENAGEGQSVEELLKKGLEHYGLEYDIEYDSKKKRYKLVLTPFLEKKASYYISDKLNANSIKLEEDSGEYCNYIVGYGDFTDDQGFEQAGLIMKYQSADLEDEDKIEAEPYMNGKIKSEDLMKRELESRLNQSLKQSLTLDFITLRKHFPSAIAKVADIVPVRHTIIGINNEVRIIEVVTKRDHKNRIYKQDVVLGEMNRRQRYMKRMNEAANVVSSLGGRGFASSYKNTENKTNAVVSSTQKMMDASNALNADGTGFTSKDGQNIVSIDTNAVIKVSNDGGETYKNIITGEGIDKTSIPSATTSSSGLMTSSDKKKLDNLPIENGSIVITGNDNKKYNLVVKDGKLGIEVAK
ncbi:phage tail protein [Staphylococcus saprophyticus]|uniref:tail tube TT1 domain-containing protein n=1 Tax=Staphylococcus saprophyticus TaxID=29385 RepID=UPI00157BCAC7|nr:phage tail protein [Staphylococcus saprophyticus]QKQ05993.1 phage tail protein [Staphylococcus saprophyticus]